MFKDVLTHMDLGDLTTAGLLLFFVVFVAVVVYALTRTPRQAHHWSHLPLTGDTCEPVPAQVTVRSQE